MKKKRKAFTLIELLAVIIVLAIIALIAMPIIFNVIENAKVRALENSTYGVIDSVRLQYMEDLMNSEDGTVPLTGSVTTLPLSGEHPTDGTWEIINGADVEDGRGIKVENVKFDSMKDYVCESVIENNELTGKVTCVKDNIRFIVEDGVINDKGWAKDNFNVQVVAEGVSNLKYCLSDTEKCTPDQTVTSSGINITTEGSTYLCVVGDGAKVRCNIYNLDKTTPTLTAKETTITIVPGANNEISTYLNEPTYGISNGSVVCKTNGSEITNTSSLAVGSHTITCNAVSNSGLSSSDVTLTITVEERKPEPNEPKLFSNMIPVTYNTTNSSWTYANKDSKWYDYKNGMWANAVVLKANPSTTYSVGDPIAMSDIAQMYVWIPRYKYTIFNGNYKNPQLINVTFEEGTATTGSVRCHDVINTYEIVNSQKVWNEKSEECVDSTQANNDIVNGTSTYTHPAFCFGRKNTDGSCNGTELEGIWVGKFEVSGSIDASNLTVLPNANPLVQKAALSYFTAMRGVAESFNIKDGEDYADSHMMKNMEWGAVAYLKQSEYGLGTTDIALNNYKASSSPYYMTGCGSAVGTTTTTATCAAYHTANGQAASTTGNIYGVYDMSGSAREYVMGNMVNESGKFQIGSLGSFSTPDEKYYDVYSYNTSDTILRGKLGDGVRETGFWYSDEFSMPHKAGSLSYPWFERGGFSELGMNSGVFASYFGVNTSKSVSSRLVISQP